MIRLKLHYICTIFVASCGGAPEIEVDLDPDRLLSTLTDVERADFCQAALNLSMKLHDDYDDAICAVEGWIAAQASAQSGTEPLSTCERAVSECSGRTPTPMITECQLLVDDPSTCDARVKDLVRCQNESSDAAAVFLSNFRDTPCRELVDYEVPTTESNQGAPTCESLSHRCPSLRFGLPVLTGPMGL